MAPARSTSPNHGARAESPPAAAVGAIVLCGGHSKRMGQPKALLPFGPERLLQRVVRLVQAGLPSAAPIVVVAAQHQLLPTLPAGVAVARDSVADQGPLQGLVTGLAALPPEVDVAYLSATDAPFLEPRWINRLIERIGQNDLALPYLEGHPHPLCALYRRQNVLPVAQAMLASAQLRPADLAKRLPTTLLDANDLRDIDPSFGTIKNLNTPEDYAHALAQAGFSPTSTKPTQI